MIALHLVGREPVGEQTHLFLDAVFHLAAGAVEPLVKILIGPLIRSERSYHEARVLALVEILCFGHHAAGARPALASLIRKFSEHTRRLASGLMKDARLLHLGADDLAEPLVARQPEQVINGVGLAPGHQFFAAEAAVGAQHDAYLGPSLTHLSYDATYFLLRTRSRVLVGRPQTRAQ